MEEFERVEEINVVSKPSRRILAYLVDLLINLSADIVLFLPVIITAINALLSKQDINTFILCISSVLSGALVICFYAFYFIYLPTLLNGQTIGKRINKIRVIDIATNDCPSLKAIFMREGSRVLIYLFTFGIGAIASTIALCLNNKHMTFHEQISKTRVVNVNMFSVNTND